MAHVLKWDEASALRDRQLLPADVGDRFEPSGPSEGRSDRYRGALVGLGLGNALGRPVDGWSAEAIVRRLGDLTRYPTRPNPRWLLPAGQLGDQAQLAILTAASIEADGALDPAGLGRRLAGWLPVARTPDDTTRQAISALRNGAPWMGAGVESPDAGGVIRAVPVGLAFPADGDGLRQAAALAAVVTHRSGTAVAASTVTAAVVAHLVGAADPSGVPEAIDQVLEGVPDPAVDLGGPVATLRDRLTLALDLVGTEPETALGRIGTGRSALQALPAALWAVLSFPEDPMAAIRATVQGGGATGIVAALTGAFAGALHGSTALPDDLVEELEYADGLSGYADGLLRVSSTGAPSPAGPARDPLHPATYAPFRLGGVSMPTLEHAIRSTAAADPAAGVRLRLLPTPADTRRAAASTEVRPDWPETAPRSIGAVLRRRFDDEGSDHVLKNRSDDDLEALVGAFENDEPFDYPVLLALRREELAALVDA